VPLDRSRKQLLSPMTPQSTKPPVSNAPSSIEEVFENEEPTLVRYAYGLLGRRELAEEVVQDAFLKLHGHWSEVENPRAWLFRCVRNLSLNLLRKNQRELLDESLEGAQAMRDRPDEELDRIESIGLVQTLIAEMSERDQMLLKLKYFQGLKYEQIAQRLEMSVGHVGYRLHHLLKDLGERLKRSGMSRG